MTPEEAVHDAMARASRGGIPHAVDVIDHLRALGYEVRPIESAAADPEGEAAAREFVKSITVYQPDPEALALLRALGDWMLHVEVGPGVGADPVGYQMEILARRARLARRLDAYLARVDEGGE